MSFRKLGVLFLACIMTAVIFTGCGGGEENNSPAGNNTGIRIGMIKHLNASEEDFNGFFIKLSETFSLAMPSHKTVFFDNMNSMQMALESRQIDEISTYRCVADYLAARNPQIEILSEHTLEFIDAFCLALREEDTELKEAADNAIVEMRNDGTLDQLIKQYITDANKSENPPVVEMQHIDGAETIKVAVTGDLPPLDFVSADGKAAGFNTAVLSELSKRINKNIELVQVDSAARAAALTSGQVDISFWAIVPVSEIIPSDADKPAGIALTSPYYRGKIVHIGLKKS